MSSGGVILVPLNKIWQNMEDNKVLNKISPVFVYLTYTFAKWKFLVTEKLTNSALITPP